MEKGKDIFFNCIHILLCRSPKLGLIKSQSTISTLPFTFEQKGSSILNKHLLKEAFFLRKDCKVMSEVDKGVTLSWTSFLLSVKCLIKESTQA